MKYIKTFKQLGKGDADIAGGKGASLGEMTNMGIPIPSGLVVLSDAFEYFIRETDIISEIEATLKKVNHKEMESVERASETIREIIENTEMPKSLEKEIMDAYKTLDAEWVAVRSSATAEDGTEHAWAGQLDSFLNTPKENVIKNVQRCFASLFTPRAIFYRFEKGLHNTHISVAVVIQKMVQSEKSGIAFSVHPVTEDYNQMIIEGSWGLGEAIVSGQVTPDSYVVTKKPQEILDINIAEKTRGLFKSKSGSNEWQEIADKKANEECLSQKEILELSDLVMKIENHYGFPCDIEWAYENKKFYIVQSRPITTLSDNKSKIFDKKEWFLAVTRNMSFWHQCLANLGWYHNTRDFGVPYNLKQLSITTGGTHTQCFFYNPHYKDYSDEIAKVFADKKSVKNLKQKYIKFGDELLKSLQSVNRKLTPISLKKFFDTYQRYTAGLMITTGYSRKGTDILHDLLIQKGYTENEIPEIIATITYPSQHTPLFESQVDLMVIATGVQSKKINKQKEKQLLTKWIAKYGNIPVNYCDEPWVFENAQTQLTSLLQKDCAKELKSLEDSHQVKIKQAKKLIKQINDKQIADIAYGLAEGTYINEYRKNIFSTVSLGYRPIFDQITKLGGSSDWRDCFYLMPQEMIDIVSGVKISILDIKKKRKAIGITVSDMGELEVVDDSLVKKLYESDKQTDGEVQTSSVNEIRGFGASKGVVRGIVKIVLSSKEFHKVNAGDILVSSMTSVDFVPVMEKSAAFVTNEGGVMSHASIVAREMDKPCIIGTKIATKVLKDGDLVEVDANNGVVKIIKTK